MALVLAVGRLILMWSFDLDLVAVFCFSFTRRWPSVAAALSMWRARRTRTSSRRWTRWCWRTFRWVGSGLLLSHFLHPGDQQTMSSCSPCAVFDRCSSAAVRQWRCTSWMWPFHCSSRASWGREGRDKRAWARATQPTSLTPCSSSCWREKATSSR